MIGYFQDKQESIVNYVSNSRIQLISDAPIKYFARYGEKVKDEPTPAMIEGQIIHQAILEPTVFFDRIVKSEYANFMTNAAKDWRRMILAENPAALILTEDKIDYYKRLSDSVMRDKVIREMIEKSTKETHGYAVDKETGMILYSRPDIVTSDGMIADLKTTVCAEPRKFNNDQFFTGYFVQLSFYNYVHGLITGKHTEQNAFFIAVEKKYPHVTCVYTLDRRFEAMANKSMRKGIDLIYSYMKIDPGFKDKSRWPGYFQGVMQLEPTYGMLASDPEYSEFIEL